MITLTITATELDQAGFYLDGLDTVHAIESFDVRLEEDRNEELYVADFIPFDPSGAITNENIADTLLAESENTIDGENDHNNVILQDLARALLRAALDQLEDMNSF